MLGINRIDRAFAAGMNLAERLCTLTGRKGCHIVLADYHGRVVKILREESLHIEAWGPGRADGEPAKTYDEFAREKVATSARHQMDTQLLNMHPHLYKPGDCVYPGAVCFLNEGIRQVVNIAGTSGFNAVDDVSISQVVGMTYLQRDPAQIEAIVRFAINRADPTYGAYYR